MTGPEAPTAVRVTGQRLWQSLMDLARIGATPAGGSQRLALTEEDREGQELFVRWATEAGCRVTRDRIGNIFARRSGEDDTRPAVFIGSHLDTQPDGGRFDGTYGVLAALEVARTLNDHGITTVAPLVIVSWANEEGARFPQPMTGSGVFSGALTLDEALSQRARDGPTFGEEIARLGLAGSSDLGLGDVGAYLEAHIEQGVVLESAGATIGIVRRGQGVRAVQVVLTGRESHSGTTPMDRRRDALLGAARIVEFANGVGIRNTGALVTVGQLAVEPNSRAVIPGRVTMVIDMRHLDPVELERVRDEIRAGITAIAERSSLTAQVADFLSIDPAVFDDACNEAIRAAAGALGHRYMDVVSGAAHDAMRVARIAPSALLFVPCRDGISHHASEYATPEDLAAGADVLLQASLSVAGVVVEAR